MNEKSVVWLFCLQVSSTMPRSQDSIGLFRPCTERTLPHGLDAAVGNDSLRVYRCETIRYDYKVEMRAKEGEGGMRGKWVNPTSVLDQAETTTTAEGTLPLRPSSSLEVILTKELCNDCDDHVDCRKLAARLAVEV